MLRNAAACSGLSILDFTVFTPCQAGPVIHQFAARNPENPRILSQGGLAAAFEAGVKIDTVHRIFRSYSSGVFDWGLLPRGWIPHGVGGGSHDTGGGGRVPPLDTSSGGAASAKRYLGSIWISHGPGHW